MGDGEIIPNYHDGGLMKMKEKRTGKKLNGLIFVVFWVLIMTILKMALFGISSNLYMTVAIDFPAIMQRLWVFLLLQAGLSTLVIGLAQKTAIRFLSEARLDYWMRMSVIIGMGIAAFQYFLLRFVDVSQQVQMLPYLANLEMPIFLVAQWFILRKNFKQSEIWLAMIVPVVALSYFRGTLAQPIFIDILQVLITGCVMLWMSQANPSLEEKPKNLLEAEQRLSELQMDSEEEVITNYAIRYGASDA
jgi:hypothetical protein